MKSVLGEFRQRPSSFDDVNDGNLSRFHAMTENGSNSRNLLRRSTAESGSNSRNLFRRSTADSGGNNSSRTLSRHSTAESGGNYSTSNSKEPPSARSIGIEFFPQSPMINTQPHVVGRHSPTMVNAVQTVTGLTASIISHSPLGRRPSYSPQTTTKSPKSANSTTKLGTNNNSTSAGIVGNESPVISFPMKNSNSRDLHSCSEDSNKNDDEISVGRTSLSNSRLRKRFSSSSNGTSLLGVLESERKLRVFTMWLKVTHADESLELWNALNTLHGETDVKARIQQSRRIAEQYLLPTAAKQVNLKSITLRAVQLAYEDTDSKAFEKPEFFNDVQCEIFYDMMQSDAYMKFKTVHVSSEATDSGEHQEDQSGEFKQHQQSSTTVGRTITTTITTSTTSATTTQSNPLITIEAKAL
jgi:hypothetical protein